MRYLCARQIFALTLLLSALPALATQPAADDGYWQTPAIQGYGRVHPRPDAAEQPSPDQTYKVVFNITKGADDPSQPNPGLDHVARAVNVFASAGVPADKLDFVAVIHGPATASVLNADAYESQTKTANPNIELIGRLRRAGVKIEVCGQALSDHDYKDDWVNPDVIITLSALSDLAIYGNRGYAFEQM